MRVKRWLGAMACGTLFVATGLYLAIGLNVVDYLNNVARFVFLHTGLDLSTFSTTLGAVMMAAGAILILVAVRNIVTSITEVLAPHRSENLSELIYRRRYLSHGQRIVVLGGGTGLSTMLRGLKRYTSNLTAIVTVTDDGGSSGRLMREYNMLPPGDIRNCIVALADNEGLMADLFQYRFEGRDEGESLGGHSFGNLLLMAMGSITGSFDQAIRETSRVLAIRGSVLPSTLARVSLTAEMADGATVCGETAIAEHGQRSPIQTVALDPANVEPLDEAIEAIMQADAVIIGPGSVYTSIIPNLLVPRVAEALRQSKARRIYVCNVMTQPGESDGFTASDHVRAIDRHAGKGVMQIVLVNNANPSEEARARYAAQNACVVRPDFEAINAMGYTSMAADFLNETNLVRHDPDKLADAIMELV
ncbi:MAG TPA: YvcK family protein [Armatimonadota bacterium]